MAISGDLRANSPAAEDLPRFQLSASDVSAEDAVRLLEVVQELSLAKTLDQVVETVRAMARRLIGSDGVAFVLRDQGQCFYFDEDAVGPLWKGSRFPLESCISGYAMLNRELVAIEDIYQDARIPHDAYRPTFVKSLVVAPVRRQDPIAAIGTYWAVQRKPSKRDTSLVQALADAAAVALANADLVRELQHAIRLRDEFLSVAGHELKTPLAALQLQVQGTIRMLASDGPALVESGRLSQRLDKASQHGERLGKLVDELLDVSRISTGRIQFRLEPMDLSVTVAELLGRYADTASKAQCVLEAEIQPGITGNWDRLRMEQVVANLLSNALKYGAGKPVHLSLFEKDGEVLLSVRDAGIGIDESVRERIFHRFERAVSERNYGGLGLGLWIANQIVAGFGGSIAVESTVGEGSTFTVRMPVALEASVEP